MRAIVSRPRRFGNPATPLALLAQNRPNPFNPSTTIGFTLTEAGRVELKIYDVAGRVVRTLLTRDCDAGEHSAVWDGCDDRGHRMTSGVFFARLQLDETTLSRKMVLLK